VADDETRLPQLIVLCVDPGVASPNSCTGVAAYYLTAEGRIVWILFDNPTITDNYSFANAVFAHYVAQIRRRFPGVYILIGCECVATTLHLDIYHFYLGRLNLCLRREIDPTLYRRIYFVHENWTQEVMRMSQSPGPGIYATNTTKLTAAYSALQFMQIGDMSVSTVLLPGCDPVLLGNPGISPENQIALDKARLAEARRQFFDYLIVPTKSGRGITVSGKRGGTTQDDIMSAAMLGVLSMVLVQKSEGVSRGPDAAQTDAYAHLRRLITNTPLGTDLLRE
jgi:hypothetical protein